MITVGIILITGFVFGELAKKIRLPKVTGYILAGIFLNPQIMPIIPKDFPTQTDIVSNIALTFITFSVGGTLLFKKIKELGKGIIWITVCEAEFAFLIVAAGFIVLGSHVINIPGGTFIATFVPISLLLAALASPTDPSATLAVTHEYGADGEVARTIMGVAAFDDAFGIINYSIAVVIAGSLITRDGSGFGGIISSSVVQIGGAVFLGSLFGTIFNWVGDFVRRDTEGVFIVLVFGLLTLCFGTASMIGVDQLLSTMTMGVIVINFNRQGEMIFKMLERYTEELIFVLFFTLSGMHLDFSVLSKSMLIVLIFFILRTIGKVSGCMLGASIAHSSDKVKKYTAGGLIPQGDIVVGLALIMKQNPAFHEFADIILGVIIGATIIHELVGPVLSKLMLKKAGEITAD